MNAFHWPFFYLFRMLFRRFSKLNTTFLALLFLPCLAIGITFFCPVFSRYEYQAILLCAKRRRGKKRKNYSKLAAEARHCATKTHCINTRIHILCFVCFAHLHSQCLVRFFSRNSKGWIYSTDMRVDASAASMAYLLAPIWIYICIISFILDFYFKDNFKITTEEKIRRKIRVQYTIKRNRTNECNGKPTAKQT